MNKPHKTATVIMHLESEGPCIFGQVLRERGMIVTNISAPKHGVENIDPIAPDVVMVLGGPIGVYQADDYPFLKTEIDIVQKRLAAKKPTVGVCLGSQIMAAALGRDVYPGKSGKEIGWHPVTINENGMKTPARHLSAEITNMFHWHGDTFDLPEGVDLLASSDKYKNQIYTIGNYALGLQCHPEVCANELEEWYVMFHRDITGPNAKISVHELRTQTAKHIETLNKQAKLFFNEWLDQAGL